MRRPYVSDDFFATCSVGFDNYIHGEWDVARLKFEEAMRSLRQRDGPSENLLDFMSRTNYKPPSDWKGVRKMSSSDN